MSEILNVNDALAWMDKNLAEDRAEILVADAFSLHHGLGQSLRNELKLWVDETPLHQHFKQERGITHPDEMSHLLIEVYTAWLKEGHHPMPGQPGYVPPRIKDRPTAYDMIEDDDGESG